MITKRRLTLIAGLLILIGCQFPAYAADPTITMTIIGDQTCSPSGSGTAQGTLIIAAAGSSYTCGSYTFRPYDNTKAARVESLGDANNDTLTLSNTKISRASGTIPDLHIIFSGATFTDLPTHTNPITYVVSAVGFFKRDTTSSLAVDSHLYTTGYIQTPASDPNPWYMLGSSPPSSLGIELDWVVCGTAGCSNYLPGSYSTSTLFTTLDLNRVLKGDFWVKLSGNSDTLTLNSLQVLNTGGAVGGPPPCDPGRDENCAPGCPDEVCAPSFRGRPVAPRR